MRLDYHLRKNNPITLDLLTIEGKLTAHLNDIGSAANEELFLIILQMAKQQGVNENLKRRNPFAWAGAMNNIRHAAEEFVLNDLIYA